jgi:hypothetical protein
MKLYPKQIIFLAVSKYLSDSDLDALRKEIKAYLRLTGPNFIKLIKKYFDFEKLRVAPIIPEDIWIYNYLMYETQRKPEAKITDIGNVIDPVGSLTNSPLLKQYASKILLPKLEQFKKGGLLFMVLQR